MRGRGRLLIIVALLIIVIGVAVVFLLPRGGGGGGTTPVAGGPVVAQTQTQSAIATTTAQAIPTIEPQVYIVVAIQDLPRGIRIPRDGIDIRPWPISVVEQGLLNAIQAPSPDQYPDEEQYSRAVETVLSDVVGKVARTDIVRFQPILSTMIVPDLSQLGAVGSDAAAVLPRGSVAVAIPIDRFTGVAYALQPGDRVDVIVSLLFVDVDEAFQTIIPNEYDLLFFSESDLKLIKARPGRFENTIIGPVDVVPREDQRPRMSTQRTIQDALVVHVGEVPPDGRLFRAQPETPTPAPTIEGAVTPEGAATSAPTQAPPRPDIIVLGVAPQDAVVLSYFVEAQAPIMLALRSAGDASRVPTSPVTLDYVMSQYGISVPGKNDFAIQPALRSIRQLLTTGETIPLKTEPLTAGQ